MEDMKTPPVEEHNEVSISSAVIKFSWKPGSIVRSNIFAKRGRDEIYPTKIFSDVIAILNIEVFFSYQILRHETGRASEGP